MLAQLVQDQHRHHALQGEFYCRLSETSHPPYCLIAMSGPEVDFKVDHIDRL